MSTVSALVPSISASSLFASSNSPDFEPLVRPLPREWDASHCFQRLSHLPGCVWLDSNVAYGGLTRYSYLAADPFCTLRMDRSLPGTWANVAALLARYQQPKVPDLPPLQGGWIGWFGYELANCFESVPSANINDFRLPVAALGMYDVVLSWDHELEQGWIVSQGLPATKPPTRLKRAYARLLAFQRYLEEAPNVNAKQPVASSLESHNMAAQFPTRWSPQWTSNFSAPNYRAAVARAVEYIREGDIFQVNLSQRLTTRATCHASDLYLHLREKSPAPFSGYASFGRVSVVSTSPERFLSLNDGQLEARPIKGTRPRLSDPTADRAIGELLRGSEKDRSENIMIVDLLRNDLSRVSESDSVKVPALCQLERYPYVWHLVSVIQSKLAQGLTAADVVAASFPGGSITGAPKIRAMEIVAELEPTVRGPYCGSLGYLSYAGDMDLNILIRTLTACDGWWQLPVGGGIVADSDPHLEEQETWHKAEGILRSLDSIAAADEAAR